MRTTEVLPEAFAIIRESMDRHIGIRAIFNPDEKFDPDQFDDEMLEAYDLVQRQMIATGQSWLSIDIPPKMYAAIRKMYPESRPPFRARPFDVQLIGGLVLYEGKIAEMATGEGKTFVAPLACFMRILEGLHCHVVTVNDYLVRRDSLWIKPAFDNLGITVGYIQSDMEPGGETRKGMYRCDITYGTNSEFGFDYLRDNMKECADLQVQGPLDFAIVDEVDSILIDEARTPLIISGAAHDDAQKYRDADKIARIVIEKNKQWDAIERQVDAAKRAIKSAEGDEEKTKDSAERESARKRQEAAEKQLEEAEAKKEGLVQYYEVELDRKSVHMTHEGIAIAQDAAGVGSFYVGNNMEWPHLMEQSLRRHVVYERDKDYVVERNSQNGQMEVVIVDEYTGRKMVGRQWSDGLHQAVEAKEGVRIKEETQTLATITLQNFFKLYKALAGMTGTAQTESEEFMKIYKLEVVTIPTNRPVVRKDNEDRVYRTEAEKWESILEEIKENSDAGRPVLVGTTSVEKSERLSRMLKQKYGIDHEVLNAKQHEREAHIIVLAGQQHKNAHDEMVGNVTIATNMAGRGTDIKLAKEAHAAGGLHVVGTERHTARRIDNQLRGRGGRQGDPGSSRFYVSLQDDLMKMFAGEWTIKVLGFLGMEEGMAIEDKRISKGILRAQKKVEERNYLQRKNLLEYDEVMDHQRTNFYQMRQQVLNGTGVADVIWTMIGQSIDDAVEKYVTEDYVAASVAEWARVNFDVAIDAGRHQRRAANRGPRRLHQERSENRDRNQPGRYASGIHGRGSRGPKDWDTKGLASWAMSRYQVQVSQNQLRKMDPFTVENMLKETALEQIHKRDTSGLMKYLEPDYSLKGLCEWAKDKFNIDVTPAELTADPTRHIPKSASDIAAILEELARAAYIPRQIQYPIDHAMTFAFGDANSTEINPYGVDYIRAWAKAKYGVDITPEHIRDITLRQLHDELVALQEQWLRRRQPGKGSRRDFAGQQGTGGDLQGRAGARFATELSASDIEKARAASSDNSRLREALIDVGRAYLRKELTDLEQFVLIQIFDQTWKDHLYAMDMLKTGIGLQAFAEKDPRIAYKKEGYEYFEQMMAGIRDKVTDLIFRARIGRSAPEPRSNYKISEAKHEVSQNYGVSENLRETVDAGIPTESAAAANEVQGEAATKVKQIVREATKVGRNDPCPCGSGKKYKKCCGVNAE